MPPVLGRLLVERVADEDEQLGRLADDVIGEICERDGDEQDRREANDPYRPRCSRELPAPPTVRPTASGEGGGRDGCFFLACVLGERVECNSETYCANDLRRRMALR